MRRLAARPVLSSVLAALLLAGAAACGDDGDLAGGGGAAADGAGGGGTASSTGTAGGNGQGGSGSTAVTGSGGSAADGAGGGGGGGATGPVIVGGDRPVEVFVPSSYVDGTAMPLVLLLHGYTATAEIQEAYLQVEPLAEELGFLYVRPQGTDDPTGEAFWNATDACCNFYGSSVDDSAYLRAVIDEVGERLTVDPSRVFLIGHSNGGFMSYRMACDHADAIAAIASLAGATFAVPDDCAPSEPVATLQIHGTSDSTILYEGGELVGSPYPGAETTVATWAAYGGCDGEPTDLPARDLDTTLPGDESAVVGWTDGCDPGGGAELWTIEGGAHVPSLTPDFTRQVLTWLLAHPKP